jgi:hypothetical protein
MAPRPVRLAIDELTRELMSGHCVLKPDESVLASFQGDEAVLLDYSEGEYYGLNAVGACVWRLICAGRSFREIVDEVIAVYDVHATTALDDIVRLVAELSELGILHINEAAT